MADLPDQSNLWSFVKGLPRTLVIPALALGILFAAFLIVFGALSNRRVQTPLFSIEPRFDPTTERCKIVAETLRHSISLNYGEMSEKHKLLEQHKLSLEQMRNLYTQKGIREQESESHVRVGKFASSSYPDNGQPDKSSSYLNDNLGEYNRISSQVLALEEKGGALLEKLDNLMKSCGP